MFVPMAEQVARERREDALRRAELHRLARLSRADRPRPHVSLVEVIRAGIVSIGKSLRADVKQPVVE
jgi:hypothetical protein